MQYFVELSPLAGLPRCLRWSSCPQRRRPGFNPWVGKIPWRRKWQPPAVFLPGEFHGQKSLVGYSPRGPKVLDMAEQLDTHTHTHTLWHSVSKGFLGSSVVKNLPANAGEAGDAGLIPGWRRSPGEGNGNQLKYSCLENPMDRGAWWATVCAVLILSVVSNSFWPHGL